MYEIEDLDITLTWYYEELVVDKVQDRSEEVVKIAVVKREKIMANLLEVYDNIQQL
jgi:hypothetical protein